MAAFRRNPAYETELHETPLYQESMAVRAILIARLVEVLAEPHRDTGQFIRAVDAVGPLVVLLRHTWHFTEYGTVNNPPQANARRAVRAAGLRFVDGLSEAPGSA